MEFRAKLERLLFTANKCPFQSPPLSSKRKGLNPLHGIPSGTYPFLLSDTSTSVNRVNHRSQSNEEMKEWNNRMNDEFDEVDGTAPTVSPTKQNRTGEEQNSNNNRFWGA